MPEADRHDEQNTTPPDTCTCGNIGVVVVGTLQVFEPLPLADSDHERVSVPIRHSPELMEILRQAGDTWGPLGVAIAAASLTDVAIVVQHLTGDTAGAVLESADRWQYTMSPDACRCAEVTEPGHLKCWRCGRELHATPAQVQP